jgi:hypothetical protein
LKAVHREGQPPLATFNIKDYVDFVEHEGLELVH